MAGANTGDSFVSGGAEPHSDGEEEPVMDLEEERLVRNIGSHPMLDRVQAALTKQLKKRLEGVQEEVRTQREDAARLATEREALGVDLYGVQQQLAQLQTQLDGAQANQEALATARTKAEEDLTRFRAGFDQRKAHIEEEQRKLERFRSELDGVHDALREAQQYVEEVKGEVALTRRATYKAEEEVSNAEKGKEKQDLYIDDLNRRIRRLGEDLALYEAQIESQRSEMEAAQATVTEAAREMEAIGREKQQLTSQWQSTLLDVKRRDEALEAVAEALHQQEEAARSLSAEEGNTTRAIATAQDEHARLQDRLDREESALRYCEQTLATTRREQSALAERAEALQASLESADAEADRLRSAGDRLQKRVRELAGKRSAAERDRQAAEAGVEAQEGAQVTARKAARNLAKSARSVLDRLHTREMERSDLENELSRVRVDTLNAEAHVEALQDDLSKVEAELAEKERLIAKYEMEIRQRNDAIEKKMSVVDRLNRRYESLTASMPAEAHMGPLHATIHNNTKRLEQLRADNELLQKQWLQRQTGLVATTTDADQKAASLRELRSQRLLLEQKRARLLKAAEGQQSDAAGLQQGMQRMRADMRRINGLIAKNEQLSQRLAESTFAAEAEFVEELRGLEEASVAAEAKVQRLTTEKAALLEDILEAERQVALWERKLQLEKETQAALDPAAGRAEVGSMRKEVDRMRRRLEALGRERDRLVGELERAVEKREDIAVQFLQRGAGRRKASAGGGKRKAGASTRRVTKGRSGKAMGAAGVSAAEAATDRAAGKQLRREARRHARRAREVQAAAAGRAAEAAEAEAAARAAEARCRELEAAAEQLQGGLNVALYDKERDAQQLAGLQGMQRGIQAAEPADAGVAAGRLEAAAAERAALREALARLAEAQPALGDVLHRVRQLTAVAGVQGLDDDYEEEQEEEAFDGSQLEAAAGAGEMVGAEA